MASFFHYMILFPSAIADLVVTILAVVMMASALFYAHKPKEKPTDIFQSWGCLAASASEWRRIAI